MTYAEKVYAMTGAQLVAEAEKVGAKVNKKGNTLKEAKATAADKIIAAWEAQQEADKMPLILEEVAETETPTEEPKKEKKARKARQPMDRTAQVEFEKALAEVTKEFGITEKRWDKIKNLVAFRDGKKTFAEVRFTRKGIKINTKEFLADLMEFTYHNQKNYYLPATVDAIPYDEGIGVLQEMFAYI